MRLRQSQLLALVPMLVGLALVVEPAAATHETATHSTHALVPLQSASCPKGTSELCGMLNRIKGLLITTLTILGVVMFLVGLGLYGTAGPRTEWASRGKWFMGGGAAMTIIAQSVKLVVDILEFIASGTSATIVPWPVIEPVLTTVHHTVLPLVIAVGGP